MNWFNLQSKSVIKCPPYFTDICCDTVSSIMWVNDIFWFSISCPTAEALVKESSFTATTMRSCFSFIISGVKTSLILSPDSLSENEVIIRVVLLCKFYANVNNISQNQNKTAPPKKTPKQTQIPPKYIKAYKPGCSFSYNILNLRMCMEHFQSQRGIKQWSITFGRRMRKTLALLRWWLVLSSGWLCLEQQ